MRKSAFFRNTSMLMVSNMISGILVFVFSIILSREIGAVGMGLYQLVMPVYAILIFVTSGGISLTMSRIAAQKKSEGNIRAIYRTVKVVCIFEIVWSILLTGIIMICADFISSELLSDSRTYYGILAFCPALIMISISSTYRGAYYGVQRVLEPAIIDIIEKIIKIVLMYPLVMLAKKMSLEIAAGAAVLSLSCGELASFVLFFISFKRYRKNNPGYGKCDNDYQLIFDVFKMAVPISLEGIVTAFFGVVVAILIPKRLQNIGIPYEEALSLLGKLQGMAMNIAFFPTVITTAFNMLLVPSITETVAVKKGKALDHRINSAVRLASIISFLTASIIFSYPYKIGNYFYRDEVVGQILFLMAPILPVIYIELISYPILNGLGKQNKLLFNSIIVQTLDIMLLYIFVGIPLFNIKGYIINMTVSSLLGIYLNYKLIIKTVQYKIDWAGILIIPMLCGIVVYIINSIVGSKLNCVPLNIIISILLYCIVYIPAYKFSANS